MKTLLAVLGALASGTAAYWFVRFGTWIGSLLTERTPLYFTLYGVLACVIAGIAALCAFAAIKEARND